ncbi:DNA replication/repair protein RecF [Gemmiger sp.]|uniref:DNA replication/repair protein RecF n=1 Tax=Gemmiger sp. TaxID=2049027 RepID=UPI002A74E30E|nr:DNA replication/repair protein RecF [Gemmiger sp.]MDY2694595.1 DNA replication/repair protein RecF [Gemmiger sp.]
MRLNRLTLTDHRNIARAELLPDPHLTVLCGPNGQGKTNLLEAVWLLTGGKSFRGSKDAELIRRGCEFSVLEGEIESGGGENSIRLTVGSKTSQRPGRTARLNGADVGRAAALAGHFQAVVFEPDLLSLVKGGPEGRRRFLDTALSQVYRAYLVALRRYARLTSQKNALLKSYDITPNGKVLLDAYDEQLAEYGAVILKHRQQFLQTLTPVAAQNYREISHGAETLRLEYRMSADAPTADALLQKLHDARPTELRAGFCLAGPHREDVEILLDDAPARIYGSQGQQRSAVLAMKLAEATVVGELFGEHPVLLLDDVLSELDDERQTYLLTRMGEHQTIVTTCDTAAFARTNGKIVYVKGGEILRMASPLGEAVGAAD